MRGLYTLTGVCVTDYILLIVFELISQNDGYIQGEKKSSTMAMLGSKGPVKRIGVLGLGKQEESALTPVALEALGIEVPLMYTNIGCWRSMCIYLLYLRLFVRAFSAYAENYKCFVTVYLVTVL